MHKVTRDCSRLSNGTLSTLIREAGWSPHLDTSRYDNLERVERAFVNFVLGAEQRASRDSRPYPYSCWQDAWNAFRMSRQAHAAVGIMKSVAEEVADAAGEGFCRWLLNSAIATLD